MYKRQVEDGRGLHGQALEFRLAAVAEERAEDDAHARLAQLTGDQVAPVSYTHLDVYKRQWENTEALRSAQALKAHSTMPSSSAEKEMPFGSQRKKASRCV